MHIDINIGLRIHHIIRSNFIAYVHKHKTMKEINSFTKHLVTCRLLSHFNRSPYDSCGLRMLSQLYFIVG